MAGETPLCIVGNLTAAVQVTRFWANVDRANLDDCWHWTGYTNEDGYGEFFWDGRMMGAHELALTFATGERRLPELDTCHSCNQPDCCNPAHLRFDTRQSNVDDMMRAGTHHTFTSRLTDDDVRMIRRRREAGAAQDDLAAHYGVSASYVSQIVNGQKRISAGGPIATERRYLRRTA